MAMNDLMMLMMFSQGNGTTGQWGALDMNKLMAQMFTHGVAQDLIKVQNFQATNNPMYLMF